MRETVPFDNMRKSLSILLIILWVTPCSAQSFASRVDKYLTAYAQQGKFMGAVLVARNGRVLFEKGYGSADAAWDVPVTPQTKFNLASLTKQFTGMAVLQLAEAGKLKIDDPVSKYYKHAPPAWEKITIYHLLSHTSGLPELKSLDEFIKGIARPYTPAELIATFRDKPLDFPPGAKRAYSNRGYYLLGYIIEQASGQKYSDYIEQHIFAPLGMRDSGYDSNVTVNERRAWGYVSDGQKLHYADYVDWSLPYAAGGLYSTVEDLLRWDQALYTEELLDRKWLDRLFTPDPSGYNYGWFIDSKGGRLKVYHEGSNPGFAAFIVRYPADKTFVVVLSNIETAPVKQIAYDVSALSFGEAVTTRP
jgi:D-alanyl-D-alanine carboxypeptidase